MKKVGKRGKGGKADKRKEKGRSRRGMETMRVTMVIDHQGKVMVALSCSPKRPFTKRGAWTLAATVDTSQSKWVRSFKMYYNLKTI